MSTCHQVMYYPPRGTRTSRNTYETLRTHVKRVTYYSLRRTCTITYTCQGDHVLFSQRDTYFNEVAAVREVLSFRRHTYFYVRAKMVTYYSLREIYKIVRDSFCSFKNKKNRLRMIHSYYRYEICTESI